jgi:myo-inositol-1(or 4)-monophosphatase
MSEPELRALLPVVERIAREAGAIALEGYRSGARVEKKGEIDLVTAYDVACERHILGALAEVCPGVTLVAEETHEAGAAYPEAGLAFYVDPIDGTMNYAHGHPFFCVSIGLCRGSAPLLGVVFAPALDVCWSGHGTRAFRNREPCRVAERKAPIDLLCATGFPRDRATNDDNNYREFMHIKTRVRGVRRCGSAALDLVLVADGTYDAYWEQKLSPWDMAAGAAIVLAAGGKLCNYEGGPADVRTGTLIATSAQAFEPFCDMFHAARRAPFPART